MSESIEECVRDRIDNLRTGNGGWTKADLATLGVSWPPRRNWRKDLISGCATCGGECPRPEKEKKQP